MQRRLVIVGMLVLGLAAVVGTAALRGVGSTAVPQTKDAARQGAKQAAKGDGPPDPMHNALDDTPVTPPDDELAILRTTDPRDVAPDTQPVPVPQTRPNVVLMLGCTVRKDQVTPYGGNPFATPILDAMARRGTLFDDTIAAAPWTRASATAIFTGRHALTLGMVEPGAGRDDSRIPEDTVTLAEHLQARGYLTVGATSNPNLSAVFGFDQGYDAYQPGLPDKWGSKLPGGKVADAVIAALKQRREAGDARPVFLSTMMLDTHSPRTANGEMLVPYRQQGVPERVAQYRYHLHKLDEAIGSYMTRLAAMGIDETNTVFVFLGDHGEGLNYPGTHGFGHGQYLGSSAVYVPWIMSGVGVAQAHRVLGTSSHVDVLPTLLGVIGAPLDPATSPTDGRDWSDLVRGAPRAIDRDYVFTDTWFSSASRAAIYTPYFQCQEDYGSASKLNKKRKFVAGCYDRRVDVLFIRPLTDADPRAAQFRALQTTLDKWRESHTEALITLQHENAAVTDDLARQLGALGYVDEPQPTPPAEKNR